VSLLHSRTRLGFAWRAVGASPGAARTAGIDVARAIVGAMALSGALAGLAAAHYVLGYQHCYESGISRNVGYFGLAVALLGRSPGGIVAASLLFGFLSQGGLAVADQVPKDLIDVLVAVVVLAVSATARIAKHAREAA
jgi:simple sugar transport system permease protein